MVEVDPGLAGGFGEGFLRDVAAPIAETDSPDTTTSEVLAPEVLTPEVNRCIQRCPNAFSLFKDAIIRIKEADKLRKLAGDGDRNGLGNFADNAHRRAKDAVIESRLKCSDCPGPKEWHFGRITLKLCADKSELLSRRFSVTR